MSENTTTPDSNKRPHEMIVSQGEETMQSQKQKNSGDIEVNSNLEFIPDHDTWRLLQFPTSNTDRRKLDEKTGNRFGRINEDEWDHIKKDCDIITEELLIGAGTVVERFHMIFNEYEPDPP